MGIERRDFLKEIGLFTAGIILEPKELFSISGLEQKVVVNLPAYELKLINMKDGQVTETHTFPVNIGRGSKGREPTPTGGGLVYEKRKSILFRYGEDFPQYNKKKGDVIYWKSYI